MESIEVPGQTGKLYLLTGIALVFFFILTSSPPEISAAASVQFLHLAPNAGPVEIWFDGQLIEPELNFKDSTDYAVINSGNHRMIIKTLDGPDTVVLNSPFPFREDKEYTVAITGERKSQDLQLLFTIDDCPPNSRLAQVKFTNTIPKSFPVDLSIKYGPTLYRRLAFRTGGGCQLVPPDSYFFRLIDTGSGELIAEQQLELKEGTRYNIFATEPENGEGVQFLYTEKLNVPEESPKIFGIEQSVLQLLGAGLIASLVILVLGR